MTWVQRETVTVTTAADGTATAYTGVVTGRVATVIYTADGTSPYDATVDVTITAETTGQSLWVESNVTASKTVHPRAATHDTAGAAALYAGGGTAVRDYVHVAQERIKIVLAQGGNAKVGQFVVVLA